MRSSRRSEPAVRSSATRRVTRLWRRYARHPLGRLRRGTGLRWTRNAAARSILMVLLLRLLLLDDSTALLLLLHLVLQLLLLEDVHLPVRGAWRSPRTGTVVDSGRKVRRSRRVRERPREVHRRRRVRAGKLDDERISLGPHGLAIREQMISTAEPSFRAGRQSKEAARFTST